MEHRSYPKCIYAAGGRSKIVQNAVEHQAAGPGWFESPADIGAVVEPAAGAPAETSSAAPAAAAAPAAGDPLANQPEASEPGVELTPEQEAEKFKAESEAVYSANVATIVNSIGGATIETLQRLKKIEEANPKQPRLGILRAVEGAIEKLNAAPKE